MGAISVECTRIVSIDASEMTKKIYEDVKYCADYVHRGAIGLEEGWNHALRWFRDDLVFVSCLLYGPEFISLYVFNSI